MDPSKIYGAALANQSFNAKEFFSQPPVILRLLAVLFAIIVFGAVSSGCRTVHHVCIYNGVSSACSFAVAIGVFAFLLSVAFLASDAMINSISNIKKRRQLVIGDLALSGLWTFLWLVGFCLLTNKWTTTTENWLKHHHVQAWQENNARSALVFSFFSIGVWAGITFFALQRFRLGQAGLGSGATDAAGGIPSSQPAGYGGLPTEPNPATQTQQQQSVGGGDQYYTQSY